MGERHLYWYNGDTGSSTKTFTVPTGSEWHIDSLYVYLAATATVGARRIEVQAIDTASRIISIGVADTTQAASSTGYYYFGPEQALDAGFTAERIRAPMFDVWLRPGHSLKVYDNAAIAADSDDMTVAFYYTQRDVLS